MDVLEECLSGDWPEEAAWVRDFLTPRRLAEIDLKKRRALENLYQAFDMALGTAQDRILEQYGMPNPGQLR
jgi:hypothetical protein